MNPAGAIIDLDGTVYRGEHLLSGADTGITLLRENQTDVLFVSNKPIERRDNYCKKLNHLGIPCEPMDIITSATVTADFLRRHHPDSVSYVVGEKPLIEELEAGGLTITQNPKEATVIIASMDRKFDYSKLSDALDIIEDEALFIATNPDRTCPVAGGEIPDAAGMIGAIQGVTNRELDHLMGKPSDIIMTIATERLGVAPPECLMIGDRLETDIKMGNKAGMETVLVLSGVTNRDDLSKSPVQPDHVLDSISDVKQVMM